MAEYQSDTNDVMEYMSTYADAKRCAGGRIVARQYCCMHCGSSDPSEVCESPKPGYKRQAARMKKEATQ